MKQRNSKNLELHKHHIVPKHMGGTDDPENIIMVDRIEHSKLHYELYLKYGKKEDLCASYMLKGDMENFRKIYNHLAGKAIQKR